MKNTMRFSSSISVAVSSPRLRPLPLLFVTVVISLLLFSIASSTFADSATWKTNPGSGDWNTASNWMPPTIPNGPADTATFVTSNTTNVFVSVTQVSAIVFNSGASPFTITMGFLTVSGVGITNNSGITQSFVTAVDGSGNRGFTRFVSSATAGSGTIFTNTSNTVPNSEYGGTTAFFNTSTAGNSTFINEGGAVAGVLGGLIVFDEGSTAGNGMFVNNGGSVNGAGGSLILFRGRSSAGDAIITNNGGAVSGAGGSNISFFGGSSAGDAIITNNGGTVSGADGSFTGFNQRATAGNATLIANGGLGGGGLSEIGFFGSSKGGKARLEVFGNGELSIEPHNPPGVTIGSIEGNGAVLLGANNLTVGSNNLNTKFSGVISGDSGGSLTKIGSGKLVLKHRNTYSGGTTVKRGKLIVNNTGGSGTGSGPVQVDGGWLGGKGIIAGAVTVGAGTGSGAVLAPGYVHGVGSPGALTIQSALTFSVDATYNVEVNSSLVTTDEVIANGVTINSGAQFSFADIGSGTLTPGTVFTVIDNSAATPIAGTFSNLPDGSMFTVNGNTYQVNYEGGDGNDLTLTVV
jgi:autotransporter-associated beta strand protein